MEYGFNSIGNFLKNKFGCKVIKLSLDAGMTCPNRDGAKGIGGCIFCSAEGSGDMASDIPGQIQLLSKKWPSGKYIAYFQSHTNTYAPISQLREKFYAALNYQGGADVEIVGLAIATRPDCLSPEVLNLLDELNQKTFLWVELGLQTIHESTAALINRCYPLSIFDQSMEQLSALNIKTVIHLIFGLPKESRTQMLESVEYVCQKRPFGIKLHLLNVVRGATMETSFPGYIPFQTMEEYVSLVTDALELIPAEVTIHRLTADAPRRILVAPEWSYQKRTILNNINNELKQRETWQGKKLELKNFTKS